MTKNFRNISMTAAALATLIMPLSAFVPLASAAVPPSWDLTGIHNLDFTCVTGCSGVYSHTLDIVSEDLTTGDFTGTGFYDANPSYTWTVAGNLSGSDVSFTITYTGLNAGYSVVNTGAVENDGSASGAATSSTGQTFTWEIPAGSAEFIRTAEITAPGDGGEVSGFVNFTANLNDKDGNDSVQWAVRQGTCAAGVGTVFGNVDGYSDGYTWDGSDFSATADTSSWTPGSYCFIFNPTESAGDSAIRETRNFLVVAPPAEPEDPTTKDECKNGGWEAFGFRNQGLCIQFVNTGKDSRVE